VFEKQLPVRYEIFAEGWLQGDAAWGRPVDILILKDGSLLVSDDRAGAIYRISYDRSPGGPTGEK
jgi:glucose/arabinose dehydrogenase